MSLWSKITQGLGIGIQMAAPVLPLVNPVAAAALKVAETVVLASVNPTPEKAIEAAFNTLGVPLQGYERTVLANLSVRVAEQFKSGTHE